MDMDAAPASLAFIAMRALEDPLPLAPRTAYQC